MAKSGDVAILANIHAAAQSRLFIQSARDNQKSSSSVRHRLCTLRIGAHRRGIERFAAKVPITIYYEGLVIPGAYEADFIVEDCVVVELKATSALGPVDARQLLTYLRFSGCPLGLLLNFGAAALRDGIKRIVNNFPEGTLPGEVASKESGAAEE